LRDGRALPNGGRGRVEVSCLWGQHKRVADALCAAAGQAAGGVELAHRRGRLVAGMGAGWRAG